MTKKIRRDDLARAVDQTGTEDMLINTGITQGVGLFRGWLSGRGKAKQLSEEMKELAPTLQRIEIYQRNTGDCLEILFKKMDAIAKKLEVEDEGEV